MGYSADLVEGRPITLDITGHDIEAMLRATEAAGGMGHISWVDTIDNVIAQNPKPIDTLANVLADYGFWLGEEITDTTLVIEDWGGDKLGSSWEDIWRLLITPMTTDDVTWIMRGEDGLIWTEVIKDNVLTTKDVIVTVKEDS